MDWLLPHRRRGPQSIAKPKPDIVVLEVLLPGELDGLECARRLLKSSPAPKTLVLTDFFYGAYLNLAQQIGVHGFLAKPIPFPQLVAAVQQNQKGDLAFAKQAAFDLIDTTHSITVPCIICYTFPLKASRHLK